jgi:hypothetical protein
MRTTWDSQIRGLLAVQEIGGHVGMEQEALAGVVDQIRFVPEQSLPDDAHVLPADEGAQDVHQGRLPPACIPGQYEDTRMVWLWLRPSKIWEQ